MRRRAPLLLGGLLIVLGVLWLLDAADVVDVWRWGVIAPLVVIAVGVWRIVTAFGGPERDTLQGTVDTFAVLSDRHLHGAGTFEGGSIASVLADVELDLRHATIEGSSVELTATTILADLDIVVPATWRVRVEGPVILASVKVPDELPMPGAAPSATPGATQNDEAGPQPPELVVRALSVLGDLTVRRG